MKVSNARTRSNASFDPEIDAGIAGTKSGALKCLAAHAAFALARPGYVLGEQILEEVGERWCPDARCAGATEVAP